MAQQAASLSAADFSLPHHGSAPYLLRPQLLQKSLGSPPCSVPTRQTDGLRAPLWSETSAAPRAREMVKVSAFVLPGSQPRLCSCKCLGQASEPLCDSVSSSEKWDDYRIIRRMKSKMGTRHTVSTQEALAVVMTTMMTMMISTSHPVLPILPPTATQHKPCIVRSLACSSRNLPSGWNAPYFSLLKL